MKQIPLTQGKFALVDDEDYGFLNQWKWYAYKNGGSFYARRTDYSTGKRKGVLMHRLIAQASDSSVFVDHKDGNGINNQRLNIRVCTKAENSRNRGHQKNSASGVKGVVWDAKRKKWVAYIKLNGKSKNIGGFDDISQAEAAYHGAAKQLFGEYAWNSLNL